MGRFQAVETVFRPLSLPMIPYVVMTVLLELTGRTVPGGMVPRGVKVSRITRYPAGVKLSSVLLRLIERLTVDLGPGDPKQSGLEADTSLSSLVTALEGEGLGEQITECESDEYLQPCLSGWPLRARPCGFMVLGRLGAATLRHTDGPQIRPRHVRDEPGKYGDAGLRG